VVRICEQRGQNQVQPRKYRISEEDSEAPGGGHTVTALSHNRVKGEKWYLATGISVAALSSLASKPGAAATRNRHHRGA
jgi:hypothetical protein